MLEEIAFNMKAILQQETIETHFARSISGLYSLHFPNHEKQNQCLLYSKLWRVALIDKQLYH